MTDTQAQAAAMKELRAYRKALEEGSDLEPIETRFFDAVGNIEDDVKREALEPALMALTNADAEERAQEYAKISARFIGIPEGFDLGAAIAQDGQKGLFFPTAAAYLGQVEGIVDEIAAAVETVKEGINEIKSGVASADDAIDADNVDGLIDAGEKIRQSLEGLMVTFTDLKTDLSS